RSVKPGLNILITDYSRPFYQDFILPYGRLRESRKAYHRADIIIVSKCPSNLSREEAREMEQHIHPLPTQKVFFSTIEYDQPYDFFTQEPLSLEERSVILVCCIARPEPLVSYVKSLAKNVHVLSYP